MALIRRIVTAVDGRDVVALVGLGLMAGGLVLVYVPAALIVPGALLFALAIWPAARGSA